MLLNDHSRGESVGKLERRLQQANRLYFSVEKLTRGRRIACTNSLYSWSVQCLECCWPRCALSDIPYAMQTVSWLWDRADGHWYCGGRGQQWYHQSVLSLGHVITPGIRGATIGGMGRSDLLKTRKCWLMAQKVTGHASVRSVGALVSEKDTQVHQTVNSLVTPFIGSFLVCSGQGIRFRFF